MLPKKVFHQQLSTTRAPRWLRGTHLIDVALARNAVEIHQAGTVVAVEQDAVWGALATCLVGPYPGEEHGTDRDLDSRVPRCINYAE